MEIIIRLFLAFLCLLAVEPGLQAFELDEAMPAATPTPRPQLTPTPTPTDFNRDGHPDYVLGGRIFGNTAIWYLNNNVLLCPTCTNFGPTLPTGWELIDSADFDGNGYPDYVLFNKTSGKTAIWYLKDNGLVSSLFGPDIPAGWALGAVGDFNGDGKPDYVLYTTNFGTRLTQIWYMTNNIVREKGPGPTLTPSPSTWSIAGVADFDRDGHPDYLLVNAGGQTEIWYMSGRMFLRKASGPRIEFGYELIGTADYDGDGYPDYALDSREGQTKILYLNANLQVVNTLPGPNLPIGWELRLP
jgi:hypothetical protein